MLFVHAYTAVSLRAFSLAYRILMSMVNSCGMKFRKEIICDFTHLHGALNTVAFAGHSVIGHVDC